MEYRQATAEDTAALVRLGRQFLAEVYDGRLKENPEQMAAMVQRLITDPNGWLLVAVEAGVILGMIGLFRYDHHLSGESVVGEIFWYVDPEARGSLGLRLLSQAKRWARKVGAVRLQMIAPTRRVCEIYEALGYRLTEYAYELTL